MRSAILATLIFAALAQAAPPAVPPPDKILSTLRPGHPRLIVLADDVARARQLIASDPAVRAIRDRIKADADKILNQKPIEHVLVGPRLLAQSRLAWDRIYTLATMYRLEGDVRYAQRAEQEMLTAAAFPDWNPKHFLDTAEMTNALGTGYDWLYDVLPASSRTAIRTAIVEKGLKEAEKIYRAQRWWVTGKNNWNQVCNGGITVGALAVADEEPELAGYILSQAATSIRRPTALLAPDGGWNEGPGYWNYAMRYAAYYLAAMQTALGTEFGLHDFPGFAETGLFRIHFVGPTEQVFNYADAGEGSGSATQMFLFAQLFNRPLYAYHHRAHLHGPSALDLWWYDTRGTQNDLLKLSLDAFFRNVDVAFLRGAWTDDALWIGFKGGDNAAPHGHLDLGSFVLDAAGQRWATDLGPDDYNLPAYFGKKRWTYYRLRTESHNTLLIEGENQNPKAKAPIIAFNSTPQRAFAVADLTAAYAKRAKKVLRGVALLDRKTLVIQDEIDADTPLNVEWLLHTRASVKIDGPEALLTMKDRTLHLRAVEAAGGTWSVQPVKIDPPQKAAPGVSRLALKFATAPPHTRIVIEISTTDSAAPQSAPVKPLSAW